MQLKELVALLSLPTPSDPRTSASTSSTPDDAAENAPAITDDAVYLPTDRTFPLLQFAEHPVTGQGCWSVHPCHVGEAVGELLAVNGQTWLETWVMLSGAVVDLA